MSDDPRKTLLSNPSTRQTIAEIDTNVHYDRDGVKSGSASPTAKRRLPADEAVGTPVLARRESTTTAAPDDYQLPYSLDRDVMAPVIKQVKAILLEQKFLSPDVVESETERFFGPLGLDAWFFNEQTPEDLAKYIVSLASAKMIAQLTGGKLTLSLNDTKSRRVMYGVPSTPGSRTSQAMALEYRIETDYLGEGYRRKLDGEQKLYRLQCYRSSGTVSADSKTQLRLYVLEAPTYPADAVTDPAFIVKTTADLAKVADQSFLSCSTQRTRVIVSEMLKIAAQPSQLGPVIRGFHYPDSNEFRLLVCYRQGTTHSFMSGLADLYHSYGASSSRKYVEHFSHGYVLYSAYLNLDAQATSDPDTLRHMFEDMKDDASILFCLPRTSLSPLIKTHGLSWQEHAYSYSAWKFAFHFLSRYSDDYGELLRSIGHAGNESSRTTAMLSLGRLKGKLDQDTLPESRLRDAILEHTDLVRELYKDFEHYHSRSQTKGNRDRTRAPDDRYLDTPARRALLALIKREATSELEEQIFRQFLVFNHHILRTNFYKRDKVALSFRLDPGFLNKHEYPIRPYAVFFVLGSEFRGFHVRFQDVARGGIRIVRSRNMVAFLRNLPSLFDEAYNLAATQQRKNKDIPEGGSKGAILLSVDHQDKGVSAFEKYVDALLDLLLPDETMVDYYRKEEILFLGPDEGTADVMNWASAHARTRGASFWKAFTTGKSRSRGGIPHDMYGMTTCSIHAYVVGCLNKLGLKEEQVTKLQTGGPDGDLGSNEILISKDKTIGIVDGGGVLYDPRGLNRDELQRLARQRSLSREFDKSLLSPDGWYIDVDHVDLADPHELSTSPLPEAVLALYSSGVGVRNAFHLSPLVHADLFVPCGGRPRAVDINNVDELFTNNSPRFKVIVEGANLFFTQEARLKLEAAGAILYKDASANKGGVTSSSLEVFAALALNDEEFSQHMCVSDDSNVPPFYKSYVEDVLKTITHNAELEFECLWREHERTGRPRCELSDEVSYKINKLNSAVRESTLWHNEKIKRNVLKLAVPPTLLKLLSIDKLLERVPESYMRALFCAFLASRFVYRFGLDSSEFAFFEFTQELLQ